MRAAPHDSQVLHGSQALPRARAACRERGSAPAPRLTSANRVGASMLPAPQWDLLGEGNPSWVLLLGATLMGKARFILWAGRALQK